VPGVTSSRVGASGSRRAFDPPTDVDAIYGHLLVGDGGFDFVGDQASTLPGWQRGAMMSAEHVAELIVGRQLRDGIAQTVKAPDALGVAQGLG
jgi:monoamine oxidase